MKMAVGQRLRGAERERDGEHRTLAAVVLGWSLGNRMVPQLESGLGRMNTVLCGEVAYR